MERNFVYDSFVTGSSFIGRNAEINSLIDTVSGGGNIAIYEPAGTGKTSLVQQAFLKMKGRGLNFIDVTVDLFNVRSLQDFATRLGSELLRACCKREEEYPSFVNSYLSGTHFVFDLRQYEAHGNILSLNWNVDAADLDAIWSLPYRIAADSGVKVVVVIEEFQNIMLTEDGDLACCTLEKIFGRLSPEDRQLCSYIFCGSQVNAMWEIFGSRRYFFRQVERLKISEIDTRDIIEFITSRFMTSGKVVTNEQLLDVCTLLRNNIQLINHFFSLCDALTRGYINDNVMSAALNTLLAIHSPHYRHLMNDLTDHQVNMLKAILDGHTKFTSAEVIRDYRFNSSANVRRLREALCKKEIIFFDDNGRPYVIDPLFEYWARNKFYEIKRFY